MSIRNRTTKKTLAKHTVHCRSFVRQGIGLTFRHASAVKDTGWIFYRHGGAVSITMWFVFFPIDVVFLDKRKKVIDMVRGLKPWSLYTCSKNCYYVIECAQGTLSKTHTKNGNVFSF